MPTKFALTFLKVMVNILFYGLIVFTAIFLITAFLNISGTGNPAKNFTGSTYSYEVVGFGKGNPEPPVIYSQDSLVRYHEIKNHYKVQVTPNSAFGFYALFSKLIFLALAVGILWNFKKIFRETRLDQPFRQTIPARLKTLALLFVASDILKLVNYFLFNSFLKNYFKAPHFELLTEVGSGLITGLVILIIAVVYEKGIVLQEENALTV